MSSDDTSTRRSRVTIRRFESAAEADRHEIEFWMRLPDAERVLRVWQLSQELWLLHGGKPYEPGLHRSVARLQRR